MEMIPFTPDLTELWRNAADRSVFSPSPLGGPEYSSTMKISRGQTFLFKSDNILIPLIQGKARISGLIKSRSYTGLRFNSMLYSQDTDIRLPEILSELPGGCFLKLHIPENIYTNNREIFQEYGYSLEYYYEYYKVLLPDTWQAWFNFPRVGRSNINRALDSGVTVKIGGEEYLDQFYPLFLKSFSRWKSRGEAKKPHNIERFRRIFELPGNRARIAIGFSGNKPIAGVIFCFYERTAGAFHAGMDFKYQNLRATDLVHAEIIRFLIDNRISEYNLGGTIGSKKLGQFKKKLGALTFKSCLLGRHRFPRLYSLFGKRCHENALKV